MDLTTGVMEDFGFALQYLVHDLKGSLFLIGGQYQVPILKGKVPDEILNAMLHSDASTRRKSSRPDKILRKMFDAGKIQQHGNMQLISTVTKNIDEDDKFKHQRIAHHMDVPSLLHVMDKTDLKRYIITKSTSDEKNEGYLGRLLAEGWLRWKQESQVEKEIRDIFKQ